MRLGFINRTLTYWRLIHARSRQAALGQAVTGPRISIDRGPDRAIRASDPHWPVRATASLEAGREDVGAVGGVAGVGRGEERLERRSRNAEALIVTDEVPARERCRLHVERPGDVLLAPEGHAVVTGGRDPVVGRQGGRLSAEAAEVVVRHGHRARR